MRANFCIFALDRFGLSFCFVATVRYKFLCWSDLSYCFVATVRCEFLCWFGLSFCFVATVRCKFLCWFDPSLCFVATVGCLFCEYLCWIDLELIGKCCLCLCSNNVKENEWKEEFLCGNQCHELCISPPMWLQYVPKEESKNKVKKKNVVVESEMAFPSMLMCYWQHYCLIIVLG